MAETNYEKEGELIWKSEEDQKKEVATIKQTRSKDYGRDGYVECAKGVFIYRGIKYLIRVVMYFNYDDGFKPIGSNRISDKHALVEHPENDPESKALFDALYEFHSEFLYHDTQHFYNDKMNTEEQIDDAHRMAKTDIDWLLDGTVIEEIDKKIKDLQKKREKIRNLIIDAGGTTP